METLVMLMCGAADAAEPEVCELATTADECEAFYLRCLHDPSKDGYKFVALNLVTGESAVLSLSHAKAN